MVRLKQLLFLIAILRLQPGFTLDCVFVQRFIELIDDYAPVRVGA